MGTDLSFPVTTISKGKMKQPRVYDKEYHRNYYLKHKRRIKARIRCYVKKNKNLVADRKRRWYEQNRKAISRKRKKAYRVNREKYLERHKIYYIKNREKILNNIKKYVSEHPIECGERKRRHYRNNKQVYFDRNRRREMLLKTNGCHTIDEWNTLKRKYKYRCAICGNREPFKNQPHKYLTRDHIVPISKGGTDNIENIQPACIRCNISKGNK